MFEDQKGFIPGAFIAGLIFIILGTIFIISAWGGYSNQKTIIEQGGRAIGEITKKYTLENRRMKNRTDTDYKINFEFKTDDESIINGSNRIAKYEWDKIKVGDSIEIAYDLNEPDNNFPTEHASLADPSFAFLMSCFGAGAIILGGIMIFNAFKEQQ